MSISTEKTASRPRWLAANPDKAWGEKFFLVYSPVWILLMALTMTFSLSIRLNEAGLLILSGVIALPLILVPLLLRRAESGGLRWYQTYWFKANLYIGIFSVLGNYFGSEYFFDVLGMVYNYPQIRLTWDSALVGSGQQAVPLMMYPLTVAYFMTYHTTAVVLLRRLKTARSRITAAAFPLAVAVLAYGWAWMETFAMANPLMRSVFYYQDLNRMLVYGSLMYACYFVVSFPIFYALDEQAGARWNLWQTIAAALSASMATIFLLDLLTGLIGHI